MLIYETLTPVIVPPPSSSEVTRRKLRSRRGKPGISISGLVVEYIVAIDVTRVRFPADAFFLGGRAECALLAEQHAWFGGGKTH